MSVVDYRSGLDEFADLERTQSGSWVSWAIYLGMSWTWCIGMFLPVLLVRDYGAAAWLIFAIPNVVGAAAMGWVLRDHDSEAMVAAHGWAIDVFSVVTSTFQIFFAMWMFYTLNAGNAAWASVIFALVVLRASRHDAQVQSVAVVVMIGSLVTILFQSMQSALHLPPPVMMRGSTALDLCALIPVSIFGFLFCPYLDATFHHARQRLDERRAKAAFSLGFGVFFFLMIIYTLLYAGLFITGMGREQRAGLVGHWVIQLGFTIGVHWYGVHRQGQRPTSRATWMRVGISFALAAIAWGATILGPHALDGEVIYRCFMGFYGLIFPAYVWLCVIPGKGRAAPNRRQMMVFAASVVIALPMFWLGFVARQMLWIWPGLAVVLLARLLIRSNELAEPAENPLNQPLQSF